MQKLQEHIRVIRTFLVLSSSYLLRVVQNVLVNRTVISGLDINITTEIGAHNYG